ncbi:MAG: hypothetical protein Q8R55_04960, partial [Candidatus Taylorbacteria bacterium]|nr:hypothetical protein [Candidatus Taylorbacteria bacterium]
HFAAPVPSQFVAERRALLPTPAPSARASSHLSDSEVSFCGDDARNFEPRNGFTFGYLDKIIPKLRAMHKEHPEWFEVPKPRSDKGRNAVDYSIN